jgi:hypothetical protein
MNLFVAPTGGISWIVGLAWALNPVHISEKGIHGGESGLNLTVNDEKRVRIIREGNGA